MEMNFKQKITCEFIPRLRELKEGHAYIELLNEQLWQRIEQAWHESPENVEGILDLLLRKIEDRQLEAHLAVDDTFAKRDMAINGMLSDVMPVDLLLSLDAIPPSIKRTGVAIGLAVSDVANVGIASLMETLRIPGTGQLILTGFKKEEDADQARIALSVVRDRLNIPRREFSKWDTHIHYPCSGGTSAGLATAVAIASHYKKRPVSDGVAFTGTLSLSGKVEIIGGVVSKILGAFKAGIKTVVIPKGNMCEIDSVPRVIRNKMRIIGVESIDEAISVALKKKVLTRVCQVREAMSAGFIAIQNLETRSSYEKSRAGHQE